MTVHARVLCVSMEGMHACSGARAISGARAMAYAHGARICITRSAVLSSARGGGGGRSSSATRPGSSREQRSACERARHLNSHHKKRQVSDHVDCTHCASAPLLGVSLLPRTHSLLYAWTSLRASIRPPQ
jgi:hypothetical protein